ncbi:MAG: ATP synthase F1 subunit gamma [Candidatus Amulumruptor caecigallinarius]|nr:ATP synthase F1 subunit gamma [Candidatus Amulumruptor caecigallinarius]MCM1397589.1 ATP synthase F1 subunit gamma [Candidatus Amulumruptor caecigallinarius]MCM1454093.1 ATP synthase F1 subunit gamma [bacterium]
MATLRELKGRIGSVASSEKITGAMKMISSAKMHKAELALKRLQPFRSQIETVIGNLLSTDAEFSSPLLEAREVHHATIVIFGSDSGLCGAYNVNIFKAFRHRIHKLREKYGEGLKITVFAAGEKVSRMVARLDEPSVKLEKRDGVDSQTGASGIKDFLDYLSGLYVSGGTDMVELHYMQYHSAGRQRFEATQLIPVVSETFAAAGEGKATNRPCIFEPDAESIFHTVLPMYLTAVLQDVFTENRASEQAARVMAMQSANDNASKLLDELQLDYNKLRQQAITSELLDILGGQAR